LEQTSSSPEFSDAKDAGVSVTPGPHGQLPEPRPVTKHRSTRVLNGDAHVLKITPNFSFARVVDSTRLQLVPPYRRSGEFRHTTVMQSLFVSKETQRW